MEFRNSRHCLIKLIAASEQPVPAVSVFTSKERDEWTALRAVWPAVQVCSPQHNEAIDMYTKGIVVQFHGVEPRMRLSFEPPDSVFLKFPLVVPGYSMQVLSIRQKVPAMLLRLSTTRVTP